MKPWRYAPCVAVAALAAGLYLPTLRFGFVLDDKHLIADNAFVRGPWSPLLAFAHHFWYGVPAVETYYRPLVNASLALNGRLLGWGPAGFHLVNVLLHALNASLVVALSRRLGAAPWAATASGAIMAIDPAAAWAVASIVARVDLLPGLFVLLAWSAYARRQGEIGGPTRGAWRRAVTVAFLFLAALLSKESALAFMAVPLLGLRRMTVPRGGPDCAPAPRTDAPTMIGCLLAVAASFGLRRFAGVGLVTRWQSMDPFVNPLAGVPFPGRLYDALRLSGRYLLYLVAPVGFSDPTDYAAPPRFDAGAVFAGSGLLIGIVGILVLWLRRHPASLPLGFTLAAFLPASNLLVPIASIYALNFLYLPLAGLSLACGEVLTRLGPPGAAGTHPQGGALKWGFMTAPVAVLLMMLSVREAGIWRDGVTLARSWTERFPHYAFAYGSLGVAFLDRSDPKAAVIALRRAVAIDDRSAETRFDLGLALMLTASDKKDLDEALRFTRSALDLNPSYPEAHVNASHILLRLDRPGEAAAEARAALELVPGLEVARLNLAEA
ncbi:MAG TPA: tetratricopeptide repeat protein, partial [Candidatus Dormibacteraeota bacterium]|nr:tetratricopeptide repeat protein [Candidatus Dormibacteraeota bacterium]